MASLPAIGKARATRGPRTAIARLLVKSSHRRSRISSAASQSALLQILARSDETQLAGGQMARVPDEGPRPAEGKPLLRDMHAYAC